MEENNQNIIEESVENQKVAETETQENNSKTEKDSHFADMRRKQQLDKIREENSYLKEKIESFDNRDYEDMESTIEYYQQREIERQMSDDLREIQEIDSNVTDLDSLSPIFFALRFNDVAPMTAKEAFIAYKTIEENTQQPKPISTGSLLNQISTQSEYFTNSQLDKLTKKQLENPKILEKAMKSMARLK